MINCSRPITVDYAIQVAPPEASRLCCASPRRWAISLATVSSISVHVYYYRNAISETTALGRSVWLQLVCSILKNKKHM